MNNMNFEEFKNWAEENIKFFLPESYRDAKIDIHDVVKTGMSYTGMTVRNEDQSIAPAINLNASYEAYEAGKPLYAVGHDMAEIVQTKQPELNTGIFSSYDSVKKNLFIRVCNSQENSEMLKNVPHTDVEDLSVTYHVMVDARESGLASATVTNAMIDSFGISKEQLHEDAVRNSQEILPVRMDSMMNMLMGLSGMGDAEYEFGLMAPPSMMVITNQIGINGASAFFYPDSMDKISEQLGGNYFMLPSSIHEVIAVPAGDKDYRDLESMVKQINMMQVAKEEQLSDHVYHYDAKEKVFELASKHDERMHGREKESLLGRLAEKKKEAAVLNDASPAKHKVSERAM